MYTEIPEHGEVIQTNAEGEIISWETGHYGGKLFATTLDPIVEHGVQQITHLDQLCGSFNGVVVWCTTGGEIYAREDYGVEILDAGAKRRLWNY